MTFPANIYLFKVNIELLLFIIITLFKVDVQT